VRAAAHESLRVAVEREDILPTRLDIMLTKVGEHLIKVVYLRFQHLTPNLSTT